MIYGFAWFTCCRIYRCHFPTAFCIIAKKSLELVLQQVKPSLYIPVYQDRGEKSLANRFPSILLCIYHCLLTHIYSHLVRFIPCFMLYCHLRLRLGTNFYWFDDSSFVTIDVTFRAGLYIHSVGLRVKSCCFRQLIRFNETKMMWLV